MCTVSRCPHVYRQKAGARSVQAANLVKCDVVVPRNDHHVLEATSLLLLQKPQRQVANLTWLAAVCEITAVHENIPAGKRHPAMQSVSVRYRNDTQATEPRTTL